MLKFAFLLTIWTTDTPQVFVEDYGLTGEDCIAALTQYYAAYPAQEKGAASCEIDDGQPWDELPASGVFN